MDERHEWVASNRCQRAIDDALKNGRAVLKFISPNDVGLTGGKQLGYYLPKQDGVWQLFSPHPPVKGTNQETEVAVYWEDGLVTDSRVKWYGNGTRAEYRMTRFGKNFPYLTYDRVGDLLVLVPVSHHHFNCYVLDLESDIDGIQATLGVQIERSWGAYVADSPEATEDACVESQFANFVADLNSFPSGKVFSAAAQQALVRCSRQLKTFTSDRKLMEFVDAEFRLFKTAERVLCKKEFERSFKDIDAFLKTAKTITQRRVSRAGRSLENHVEYVLKEAAIPHEMRPDIDGEPDVVIPSVDAYKNNSYPLDKLFVVGIKTTCKDRWRQVTEEGKRQPNKHLITLQKGISGAQLKKMDEANITLVVPQDLHSLYPKPGKGHNATILNVHDFIETVKMALA